MSKSSRYCGIDFHSHPELYRIGRGEEGVLVDARGNTSGRVQ